MDLLLIEGLGRVDDVVHGLGNAFEFLQQAGDSPHDAGQQSVRVGTGKSSVAEAILADQPGQQVCELLG